MEDIIYNKEVGMSIEDAYECSYRLMYKLYKEQKWNYVVQRFRIEKEDIFSECKIGFLHAYKTYRKNTGASFRTFVYKNMRFQASTFIREFNKDGIHYPKNIKTIGNQIRKEFKNELEELMKDKEKFLGFIKKYGNVGDKQAVGIFNYLNSQDALSIFSSLPLDKANQNPLPIMDTVSFLHDYSNVMVEVIKSQLTQRQKSIIDLKIAGFQNTEIATMHDIHFATVQKDIKKIKSCILNYTNTSTFTESSVV